MDIVLEGYTLCCIQKSNTDTSVRCQGKGSSTISWDLLKWGDQGTRSVKWSVNHQSIYRLLG